MQQASQPQNKLYVGNLSFDVTELQVKELFLTFGELQEVKIVMDRFSGKSRGFAFVTFLSPASAYAAKDALHGQAYQGKTLAIDIAKTEVREARPISAPRREFGVNARSGERGKNRGGNDRGSDRNERYSR